MSPNLYWAGLKLDPDATDDPGFIALVGRIITGAVLTHQPDDALIFKIDNWFDHK